LRWIGPRSWIKKGWPLFTKRIWSYLTIYYAGIKSIVFEREPANLVRPRDWNMGLHWGAPILQSLIPPSNFAKLESAQVDPHRPCPPADTISFLHGVTGEKMGSSTTPHIYRVRRSKLRDLLKEGLEDEIQYSKTLSNVTYSADGSSVTAHFEDGTSTTGTLLIATDGARSQTRNSLLGPEKAALKILEYGASIVQSTYTAEQAKYLRSWHPLYVAAPHPTGLFSWVGLHAAPSPDVPEEWILNHYISWPYSHAEQARDIDMTQAQRLQQVQNMAKGFADPFRSAFGWLKEDTTVWYAPLAHWDPSEPEHGWDNHGGRITLAGDAAHPMTFRKFPSVNPDPPLSRIP
jgi:2-polyprenyl-6-methoxyphenol hydroxylase-like FAD-dependent oxidoreductase